MVKPNRSCTFRMTKKNGHIWPYMGKYGHIWPWFRSQRHSKAIIFQHFVEKKAYRNVEKKNIYGHICLYKMHRRNDQKNQSKPFNQKKSSLCFSRYIYIYIYTSISAQLFFLQKLLLASLRSSWLACSLSTRRSARPTTEVLVNKKNMGGGGRFCMCLLLVGKGLVFVGLTFQNRGHLRFGLFSYIYFNITYTYIHNMYISVCKKTSFAMICAIRVYCDTTSS